MEGNAPKISVIVPMYNAEKYLKLCIDSILSQTFKDFELILIDDCSTDKTLEIAKSFDDSRIKILQNKKNLGSPGLTRNVGIDAAQGDYIYFCDNDDALLPKALENLYNAAENNFDIVNTTRWYIAKNPEFQTLNGVEARAMKFPAASPVSEDLKTRIRQEFLQTRIHIAPWLFLYRRKFLIENDIKFPEEVAEDVFFNFGAVCATSKIIKIDIPFYIYRKYQNSTTNNPVRLQKDISCLPALIEYVYEKISPLQDFEFLLEVERYWMSHVTGSYVLQFMKNENSSVISEIFNALQSRFGKNSSFVLILLQAYCRQLLDLNSSRALKNVNNNLLEENAKLKNTLENINKQISEVLKA